jgi:hypothetical protein
LAGRSESAGRLIQAALPCLDKSDLIPSAHAEVAGWALASAHQACLEAGATEEAVAAFQQCAVSLGLDKPPELSDHERQALSFLAGTSGKQWTARELLATGPTGDRQLFLLLADFQRWLRQTQGLQFIVADELRRILLVAIRQMRQYPKDLLRGLRRNVFEPAVASRLGFFSLDQVQAPALVLAMRWLYGFLAELGLVDARTAQASRSVCDALWSELRRGLGAQWVKYQFLEPYWSQATGVNSCTSRR